MISVKFPEANLVLAMNQDEYEPIVAHVDKSTPDARVTCCFRLSDAELEEIARTRTLWIQQLTFGRGFAPIGLSTQKPDMR